MDIDSQQMYAPKRASGYVGKSKLKSVSNASVRSKSMRSGMSRKSHLSRRKQTKRFNEDVDTMSRKSKASYHPSKPHVKNYKPQADQQAIADHNRMLQAGKIYISLAVYIHLLLTFYSRKAQKCCTQWTRI